MTFKVLKLNFYYKNYFVLFCALLGVQTVQAQAAYWQQQVQYQMEVQLNVQTNILTGKQHINYTNNSPDTLHQLFFHLYFNAFKPGSMMDELSQSTENLIVGRTAKGNNTTDFDTRFKRKIYDLKPEEQGFTKISNLAIGGINQTLIAHETILEVQLEKAILPHQTVAIYTVFESQVPLLCRRSGRDNLEGVRYSMGQWYPKLAEYDQEGWHPDDYVSREFYGVWGNFEVNITLDKNYKLGASGVLQNTAEIGWGYDKENSPLKTIEGTNRTWRFKAENVHDFVWSADPDYIHFTQKITNGPLLHFIYKYTDSLQQVKWHQMADSVVLAFPYMVKTFGAYPYPVYSFLHGGGGGTEYPMATLLRGAGLDGAIHEWMHSWYQMMLATNENEYAWMDEGFTQYADARVQAVLKKDTGFFCKTEYERYISFAKSKWEEPMSTPANFFDTNQAANSTAYYKGAVFLSQLGYITGDAVRDKILLEYYRLWRFKHPTPTDFVAVAEKVSGLQLKWYKDYWINTTKSIDYKIDSLWEESGLTKIRIKRLGEMPMPLDVRIT